MDVLAQDSNIKASQQGQNGQIRQGFPKHKRINSKANTSQYIITNEENICSLNLQSIVAKGCYKKSLHQQLIQNVIIHTS